MRASYIITAFTILIILVSFPVYRISIEYYHRNNLFSKDRLAQESAFRYFKSRKGQEAFIQYLITHWPFIELEGNVGNNFSNESFEYIFIFPDYRVYFRDKWFHTHGERDNIENMFQELVEKGLLKPNTNIIIFTHGDCRTSKVILWLMHYIVRCLPNKNTFLAGEFNNQMKGIHICLAANVNSAYRIYWRKNTGLMDDILPDKEMHSFNEMTSLFQKVKVASNFSPIEYKWKKKDYHLLFSEEISPIKLISMLYFLQKSPVRSYTFEIGK